MDKPNLTPSQIIDALGGTPVVARACEVTDSAVSQWRKNGIPKAQLRSLRLMFPDKFVELDSMATGDKRVRSRRSGKDRRVVATRRTEDLVK